MHVPNDKLIQFPCNTKGAHTQQQKKEEKYVRANTNTPKSLTCHWCRSQKPSGIGNEREKKKDIDLCFMGGD